MDRVQQRFWSRSPSFPIQVVQGSAASSSDSPWTSWRRVFFALFSTGKKVRISRAPRVGTGCRVELMDAVSLAGVSSVAQHGVRLLLLVVEKQEWCFPSTCLSSRCSHLEICTLPSPSCLSVLLVFGCCHWSTSYFRDACFAWFNSGYMFYERLLANFTYFHRAVHSDPWRSLSIPQNGEVCTVDAFSHDRSRAQTCTFKGPGLQKHHHNSTRRPQGHRT